MATRMQQRRGTAAQWISTNSGNGPILNAGEIGYETDTNKFKIGDGTNHWINLDYFIDASSTVNPAFGSSIVFEGATANDFETTVAVTDPTADRTITLPDATGTVVLADGSGNITVSGNLTVSGTTTTINSTTINATTGIVFEGATANDFETTITVTDPTADRTVTFQDATGTVVLRDSTDTLTNKSISLGSNTVTSTLAQLNTAVSDADLASLTGSETLTNKTLTSPIVSGLTLSDSGIVFEGATANDFETTLTVTDPTADRILTLPNETGTVATQTYVDSAVSGAAFNPSLAAGTGIDWNGTSDQYDIDSTVTTNDGIQTLTNKTLTSPTVSGLTLSDSGIVIEGSSADAHETTLTVTNPTADRTITFPDATGTVALAADVAALSGATFTGAVSGTDLTLSGNLTVNGTTTNINSTSLVVEDKNIVLGDAATPTDTTADGGGITLKGATDKTFNWVDSTDAWTSSEHINLASGKTLKYNGTDLVAAQSGNSGKYLTTDGTSTSWGTVSGYSAPTLGSTSIASGATVTTIAGLTLTAPTLTGTVTASGDIDLSAAGGPGSVIDELTLLLMGAI